MNYGSGRVGEARVARRGGTWLHTAPREIPEAANATDIKTEPSSDLAQMIMSLA